MCDQSEADELYDEFLDLDGNPFRGISLDAKRVAREILNGRSDWDSRINNNYSDNVIDDDNNNSGDGDDAIDKESVTELDLLNRNTATLYLDKNGKLQNRSDFSKYSRASRPTSLFTKVKECEVDTELKEVDEQRTSLDEAETDDDAFRRNDWGPESLGLWHSGPSSLSLGHTSGKCNTQQDLYGDGQFTTSLVSSTQPLAPLTSSTRRAYSHQQLGAKVEMVYSLLSMLGTSNRSDMSKTLLAMSSSPESCLAMRQSGCLPLLIQLIHSPELDIEVRSRAAEALQNIVLAQTDEKKRRREARVLKLLQQIREYCDDLKVISSKQETKIQDDPQKHPVTATEALMKFSFDAEHRQAMCSLGGLHAIAELIQLDHEVHGSMSDNPLCITLRRYAGMALTNLIFGDGNNKALLCSFSKFMRALVSQLMSPSEDLRQVTASVLRNLSWRADAESKQALREIGAVTALMVAAMEGKKESTLKSILSALWNLSGHCSMNKVDVCAVPGAVAFLVKMLKYKAASNTLAVVENAGGILRNISSHIAIREDYRQILRDNNCFEILLEQLKSSSLTIVSNACGTLWNLSARCTEDQRRLWEMGAISMLRSLIQSKHKMISMGSSAALKNLLSANPGGNMFNHMDSTAKSLGLQNLPTLFVRKQRALEQELDINLAETCDNIEPSGSPVHSEKAIISNNNNNSSHSDSVNVSSNNNNNCSVREEGLRRGNISKRSDSHESVRSTQSDSAYERVTQLMVKNENKALDNKNSTMHGSLSENQTGRRANEQKLIRRYKSSMIPTPAFKKMSQEKKNEKMREEKQKKPAEPKRGIPVLKSRIKTKAEIQGVESSNCDQCYSNSNFNAQYEEDFPVNYSLKYSETDGGYSGKMNNEVVTSSSSDQKKEKFEGYPDYAETDLDQPTDFSLKYGEETSSDEEIKNQAFNFYEGDKTKESGYYSAQPESEDTTRTYYTEGTPYEGTTPYNFSSSNSMSDLRIVGQGDIRESAEPGFQDEKGDSRKLTPKETPSDPVEPEKESETIYVNNSGDYRNRLVKRLPRDDFGSGVSTPERPIQYCEEGTPGSCFSRVSSLSSLTGGKESSGKGSPDKMDKTVVDVTAPAADSVKSLGKKDGDAQEEGLQSKAVTFGVTQQYECADQTPLMFSRSSSMNSLSSFEQIHQSIPDDRSSVVSDFSRMTSGIISPSELPDSPTQTVPPSPKQCKTPNSYFPGKLDSQKKSVFEDAVATYKQEDTPIEFSRATSLSSLNIDNSVKPDFNLKTNSSASSVVSMDEPTKSKEEKLHNNSLEKNHTEDMKEQIVPDKNEFEREKLELESVTEVDETILVDCINIGIQENSRRPRSGKKTDYLTEPSQQDGSRHLKHMSKTRKYQNDSRKMYSTYEESDDAVHTYYTEGTPANVSHAGSHSDLNNLVAGGLMPNTGMEDTSDDGSFCSGDTENMLAECIESGMPKAKHQREKPKNLNASPDLMERSDLSGNKIRGGRVSMDMYAGLQSCGDYMRRKDHHLTAAKDEISTFATENSPCTFSVRSSLSDLTVNSVDSPVCLSRPEVNRDQMSQALPSSQASAKSSSNSICLIESEKEVKTSDESRVIFSLPKSSEKDGNYWAERKPSQSKKPSTDKSSFTSSTENEVTVLSRHESLSSLSVESFDSSEPTPLEQALLEQCIHSGMPHKSHSKKPDMKSYKPLETYDECAPTDSRLLRVRGVDAEPNLSSSDPSSKNVNSSSAAVDGEDTEADEKKRVVVGQENGADHSYKQDGSDAVDGGHTWSEDYTSPNDTSATYTSSSCGKIQGLRVIDTLDPLPKEDVLVPNFKIGSEVRDPKFLQSEANKICREIRKFQEMELSCSMTSEMSCSSFLDSGEFSFIDLSKETGDLDASKSLTGGGKGARRLNSIRITDDPISLPSVGSAKSDLFQDVDLESSILSVASLTSEVAETYKDNSVEMVNGEKTPENALDSPVTVFDRGGCGAGDDTLIGSDTEIFDDENSTMSQENLPLDDGETEAEHPAQTTRTKRLTPKEKRQMQHDRFKTYTINSTNGETQQERRKKTTPKERRLNERDRFLTRVLGKENMSCKTEEDMPGKEPSDEDAFNSTFVLRKMISLDAGGLSIERGYYCRRSSSEDGKTAKDHLPVNPAERREILNNAKLVAISLKTAAAQDTESEVGYVSDSDAEGSHRTFVIDTATYNKHAPTERCYRLSDDTRQCNGSATNVRDESSDADDDDEDDELEKKGPRILKPGEKQQHEDDLKEAAAKAIRGRRKQVYTSPSKRAIQPVASSVPASPKVPLTPTRKSLSSMATKSLPNVPKSVQRSAVTDSPSLCREGTFTKEDGPAIGRQTTYATAGARTQQRSIPVLNKKSEVKASLRYKSAPVLRSNRTSSEGVRQSRPVSSCVSKPSEKPSSNVNRYSAGAASKVPGTAGPPRKSNSSGPTTFMRNSSSNQSIKSLTSTPKHTPNSRAKSTILQSSKSQSNGSLDSAGTSGKQKTPKKEVTSKIASLWKKVEDTKKREVNVKDTRVWITAEKEAAKSAEPGADEELVIEEEEILELASGKVVRSSTFQGLGEESQRVPVNDDTRNKKHRNSGDFYTSKWQSEGKHEGRNIISAIVPPYNYNPPGTIQVSGAASSPAIKQVDAFHKGSVKMTTV